MIANKKIDASLVDMGLPRCEKGILRKFNFFLFKIIIFLFLNCFDVLILKIIFNK